MNTWRSAVLAVALAVHHASATLAPGAPVAASVSGGQSSAGVSPYLPNVTGGYATTYGQLSQNDLQAASLGSCDFIEGAFEETFKGPLNVSRWDPSAMSGLDHCTGLAPAGANPCTAMLPSMVILNASFASYNPQLTGTGLVLRASQAPCSTVKNNAQDGPASQCCAGSTCAAWAGAHLVSQGCILYGVLELEAAFDLTKRSTITNLTAGAFYFTATYIVKSGSNTLPFDPAWNEIDIGMIEGPRGVEFHATIFTAAPTTPTVTTMDALTFDPLGPVINSGGSVKSTDGSSAGSTVPGSVHAAGYTNPNAKYNSSNIFHTYKIVWTPTWIAWMVDMSVYRNITFSIWRPQSIRQILRTNVGDSADPAPATSTNVWPPCAGTTDPRYRQPGSAGCVLYGIDRPDGYVYVRRIRYTPYSTQAVTDALTSTSMFAKYGAMPMLPVQTATASSTATYALGSATSGSGRHLLQAPPSAASLSAQLSSLVPGTTPGAVSVALTSYAIGGYVVIADSAGFLSPTTWTAGVQSAFLNGLDGDLVPDVTHITVQSVQPLLQTMQCNTHSTATLPACPLQGAFANSWINVPGLSDVAGGVVVEFTVGGYSSPTTAAADLATLGDDSGAGFTGSVNRMSAAESALLSSYINAAQAANDTGNAYLFSQDFSSVGPANVFMALLDENSAPMYAPQVYAVYTVQIVTEATSSPAVISGLNSGLSTGLTGASQLSTYPPSRTQAIADETCSANSAKVPKAWYGVGIAFVIAFGVQTIALCVLIAKVLKAKPAAVAVPTKSVETA